MLGKFFSDAGKGLSIGKTREENFAAGAVALMVVGSLCYLAGIAHGLAQFFMATGFLLFALWLGTVMREDRPPLVFQLMTGAVAFVALVYFFFGGGF